MDALFEKSEINGMVLSNRFIRSATWAGMATDEGACTPQLVNLMSDLSAGGVGLIITGHAFVRPDGQHSPRQLGIHQDALIPGLQNLTRSVHEQGSKIDSEDTKGYFISEARVFREKVHVPLILLGGIRSYEVARELVEEGLVDYISMSRAFVREPGLINRWKAADRREAACISCDNCFEFLRNGQGVACRPLEPEAAETFFPQLSEIVPTSPPHPPGTAYKISIGLEDWASNYIPVIKIQMLSNGQISERSPSFPLGTQDHQKVTRAISDLLEKHKDVQTR